MRQGQGLGQLNSKNISHISSLYNMYLSPRKGRKQALERRVGKNAFVSWPDTKLPAVKYRQTQRAHDEWNAEPENKKMLPHAQSYFIWLERRTMDSGLSSAAPNYFLNRTHWICSLSGRLKCNFVGEAEHVHDEIRYTMQMRCSSCRMSLYQQMSENVIAAR